MSERREPDGTVSKRRSWSILIAWAAAIVVLALLGSGLEGRLAPMSLAVPGTPSSRAEAMLAASSATRFRSPSCCAARPRKSTARASG